MIYHGSFVTHAQETNYLRIYSLTLTMAQRILLRAEH